MTEYYTDIETYTHNENIPNPYTDEIIVITYQELQRNTSIPIGNPNILTIWEHNNSEYELLNHFKEIWLPKDDSTKERFKFMLIGSELNFDLLFIVLRMLKHNLIHNDKLYSLLHLPVKDITTITILDNYGEFFGHTDIFSRLGKNSNGGKMMKSWYESQQYDLIKEYVIGEIEPFLKVYGYYIIILAGKGKLI